MKYFLILLVLGSVACQPSTDVFYADFPDSILPENWEKVPLGSDSSQNLLPPPSSSEELASATVAHEARLESPRFSVTPFQYYRVEISMQANQKTLWALTFYDETGEMLLADHYSSLDPSANFRPYVFYVQAKADAAEAEFWFQSGAGQTAYLNQVRIRPAESSQEITHWADSIYQTIPPVTYQPPANRFQHLDQTMAALQRGEKVRVVMLGNSIINDTGNSAWEVLVEDMYPGAGLEVITSVRGSTGCTYYQHNHRVDTFVVQYQPDLLMIGGISNHNDTVAMHSVIRQVRERMDPDPEIMILSGPLGRGGDPRTNPEFSVDPPEDDFRTQLAEMAADAQVAYFDMKSAWGAYLTQTQASYDYYLRDPIHANVRGRQTLARMLKAYFQPLSGSQEESAESAQADEN